MCSIQLCEYPHFVRNLNLILAILPFRPPPAILTKEMLGGKVQNLSPLPKQGGDK